MTGALSVQVIEPAEISGLVLPSEGVYVVETTTGLGFRDDTPIEVWGALVERLTRQQKRIEWALGDALQFGERRYGDTYAQWVEETGLSENTLATIKWVAGKIERSRPATRYGSVVKLQENPGRDSGPTGVSTTRLSGSHAMPRKYIRIVPGATTKECRACHQILPVDVFGKRSASPDGCSAYCKPCLKQPHIVERSRVATRAHRSERRSILAEMKRRPCMDCGGSFPPVCMQFDHRDPSTKVVKVSVFASAGGSMAAFRAEIEKCDLVCANCHAIRTERRRLEALR